MGTRVTRGSPLKGLVGNSRRRKTVPEVDLNVPPSENRDQEGTSAHANFLVVEPSAPIEAEAFDDDVVISSPRAFALAKFNSFGRRGRRRTVVVNVDSEERNSVIEPNGRTKRRRVPSDVTSSDRYIDLEIPSSSRRESVQTVKPVPPPPPPPPPPKEPVFKCPICMAPFVEELSTKCGHVFCKACLKAAIGTQGKCPTCRRKVNFKDAIRIYLPASD